MGLLSWIVLGLIAGGLAKLILPGKQPGGIIGTLVAGVVGAIIGGSIGSALDIGTVTGINLPSILLAFGGAIVLLLIWQMIARR